MATLASDDDADARDEDAFANDQATKYASEETDESKLDAFKKPDVDPMASSELTNLLKARPCELGDGTKLTIDAVIGGGGNGMVFRTAENPSILIKCTGIAAQRVPGGAWAIVESPCEDPLPSSFDIVVSISSGVFGDCYREYMTMKRAGLVGSADTAPAEAANLSRITSSGLLKLPAFAPIFVVAMPAYKGSVKSLMDAQRTLPASFPTRDAYQKTLNEKTDVKEKLAHVHDTIKTVVAHSIRPLKIPETGLRIAYDVISGLEYLHSKGISHSDIKPENICVEAYAPTSERAVLIDFGFAKQFTNIDGTHYEDSNWFLPVRPDAYASWDAKIGKVVSRRGDMESLLLVTYTLSFGLSGITSLGNSWGDYACAGDLAKLGILYEENLEQATDKLWPYFGVFNRQTAINFDPASKRKIYPVFLYVSEDQTGTTPKKKNLKVNPWTFINALSSEHKELCKQWELSVMRLEYDSTPDYEGIKLALKTCIGAMSTDVDAFMKGEFDFSIKM